MCVNATYDPKYLPDEFYGYKVIPHDMEVPNKEDFGPYSKPFKFKWGENVDTREHGICVFTTACHAQAWHLWGIENYLDPEYIYRVKLRRADVIAFDGMAVRVKKLILEPDRLNPRELSELPALPMEKF